jgi:hypothetical protein
MSSYAYDPPLFSSDYTFKLPFSGLAFFLLVFLCLTFYNLVFFCPGLLLTRLSEFRHFFALAFFLRDFCPGLLLTRLSEFRHSSDLAFFLQDFLCSGILLPCSSSYKTF